MNGKKRSQWGVHVKLTKGGAFGLLTIQHKEFAGNLDRILRQSSSEEREVTAKLIIASVEYLLESEAIGDEPVKLAPMVGMRWKGYPLRHAQAELAPCALCKKVITKGQRYYDGSMATRRAHYECVEENRSAA